MKKFVSLLLTIIFVLSLVACNQTPATSAEDARTQEIYDTVLMTVDGVDITYESFRYFYLYGKSEFASTVEGSKQLMDEVVNKFKRDAAVKKLLASYSQSLTDDEIAECESYVQQLASAYSSNFESVLKSMYMTLSVFKDSIQSEYEYNKLLTYFGDEKNNALDYSDAAISEYMEEFRAAIHVIISTESRDDKEALALAEDIYTMAKLDEAFEPLREIQTLNKDLSEIQASIDNINKQIAEGSGDSTLTTTLSALTKSLSETVAKINEMTADVNLADICESYLKYLEDYRVYLKEIIDKSVNSTDAAYVAMLDGDVSALKDKLAEDSTQLAIAALAKKAAEMVNDTKNYAWIPDDFKAAANAFNSDPTVENAAAVYAIFEASPKVYTDEKVTSLMLGFKAIGVINSECGAYELYESIVDLADESGVTLTKLANFALYAAVNEAKEAATRLSAVTTDIRDGIANEYTAMSGVVVTFEQLFINYSDDRTEDTTSAIIYYKPETLLEELYEATKDLGENEMTGIVKSDSGYHILKQLTPDSEYFKKNIYAYEKLEDTIADKVSDVTVTKTEFFENLTDAKITELEAEIASASAAATDTAVEDKVDNSNYILITIIVVIVTICVVVVLTVLIIKSGKETSPKKKNTSNKKK